MDVRKTLRLLTLLLVLLASLLKAERAAASPPSTPSISIHRAAASHPAPPGLPDAAALPLAIEVRGWLPSTPVPAPASSLLLPLHSACRVFIAQSPLPRLALAVSSVGVCLVRQGGLRGPPVFLS